jgi:hypothetical protein
MIQLDQHAVIQVAKCFETWEKEREPWSKAPSSTPSGLPQAATESMTSERTLSSITDGRLSRYWWLTLLSSWCHPKKGRIWGFKHEIKHDIFICRHATIQGTKSQLPNWGQKVDLGRWYYPQHGVGNLTCSWRQYTHTNETKFPLWSICVYPDTFSEEALPRILYYSSRDWFTTASKPPN